ncbi:MAG: hypothetical protein WC458_02925 [Patescibacteria group bacterium]
MDNSKITKHGSLIMVAPVVIICLCVISALIYGAITQKKFIYIPFVAFFIAYLAETARSYIKVL